MSSGPIVAAVLQKENAVTDYRTLIGATDPTKADVGTVRNLYANLLMQMQFMEAIVMIMQLLKHLSSFQI